MKKNCDRASETAGNCSREHKALRKSKRPWRAKNAEQKPSSPGVGKQERTKRLILAAIRFWELKRGIRA